MIANLYNIAAYQIAWFACVGGAAIGKPWIGALLVLLLATAHVVRAPRPAAELELIAAAAVIGLLVDSALTSSGYIEPSSGSWAAGWAPYWMVALWGAFATTLNYSLRWLTRRPVLAVLFGAVGGPLAYWAGARLGALLMPSPQSALPIIGAAWAAAMWVLAMIAARVQARGDPMAIRLAADQPRRS